MFSNRETTTSTAAFSAQINKLREEIASADAILIGAGAGMSTSAGLTYSGERFASNFADFHRAYGITDMYAGGFYPYRSLEEYWAWWSRHILLNRYDQKPGRPYLDLLTLVKGRDYFVLTTNVDHQFQLAGFDKQRLFYTQGDYGLWQCSRPCHRETYDNEATVRRMAAEQKDLRVPSALVPHCPVCGAPMAMNLRCDHRFVQDAGWDAAHDRYEAFLYSHRDDHLLLLELGVGGNTPVIIKYPFWQTAAQNPKAVYACVNLHDAGCLEEIKEQSLCIPLDIGRVLAEIKKPAAN